MIEEGAAIIDIGGESTRPGAAPASRRRRTRARGARSSRHCGANPRVFISVDTSKPEVMRAACAAGADIINDVRALRNPARCDAAARTRAGICLMHMQGEPRTMQAAPALRRRRRARSARFLAGARRGAAATAGIDSARLAVDPGFGFGKRIVAQSGAAQASRRSFEALGVPVAVGPVAQVDAREDHRARRSTIELRAASHWPPLRFSTERVSCAPTTWPPRSTRYAWPRR